MVNGAEIGATPGTLAAEGVNGGPQGAPTGAHEDSQDPIKADLLRHIYHDVSNLSFPLETEDAAELRELRARVLTQISTHLFPRAAGRHTPAVVVLGGSTGVGKSTLFNSLVGMEASAAGVLRPTTRQAFAATHPSVAESPLGGLAYHITSPWIPPEMVLVDAPDLDSLERTNRAAGLELLEAADLWIMVTTAARYGDQIPWRQVVRAADMGAQLAVVLNRVPQHAGHAIRADLTERLAREGLGYTPLFLIPDLGPHEGVLPEETVAALREWLTLATGPRQSRGITRRGTLGAWRIMLASVTRLADGVSDQLAAVEQLRAFTLAELRDRQAEIARAIGSGQCAVGTPSAHWDSHTQPGEALAALVSDSRQSRSPRMREARTGILEGIAAELEAAVVAVLRDSILETSGSIWREWRESGVAKKLGDQPPVHDPGLTTAAVRGWRGEVEGIIESHGIPPRLLRLLEPSAVGALVVAGAGGIPGAAEAVTRLFSDAVLTSARDALISAGHHSVGTCSEPFLDA